MGGVPWQYFVPFNASVEAALDALRKQVFASGKFHRSELKPVDIDEAMENTNEEGTRSILDMRFVGAHPDYFTVCPLSEDDLDRHFGTTEPTHQQVEDADELFYEIERGQGIYITVYKDGEPSEYFFAGYSFD